VTLTTRTLWLATILAIAGCAPARPPAAPQPAPPSAAAALAEQTLDAAPDIPWSANRPLTWDDFRGPAPLDGVEGARTVYLLSYESRCRGIDFTFSVTAVVLPSRSWVKPRVLSTPAESARILQHEQTHFNLTEVYARRMRRFFRELYNPCGLIDERLKESVERFVQEEADAQRRYDDETGYGLKPQVQERWDRDIATMLTELAAFAK
jgi:hypothetical protein